MADTHETIADIIAEMRFHGQQNIDAEKDKPEYGILTVEGRIAQNYADRLENVNVREHGDVAALRFAVNAVVEAIAEPNEINSAIKLMAAEGMCRNALAAKPRNCDLYSSATAAWLDWSSKNILSGETPTLDRFLVWLFARAQEGGAK